MNREVSLEMILPEKCNKSETFISGRFRELLEIYSGRYEQDGFHPPWAGYFIISGSRVVGSCGFTGEPQNGRVEIAFWTFPRDQGVGVATEACRQMVDIAQREDASIIIAAETNSDCDASARVLEKNGFLNRGVVPDENNESLWQWEYEKRCI